MPTVPRCHLVRPVLLRHTFSRCAVDDSYTDGDTTRSGAASPSTAPTSPGTTASPAPSPKPPGAAPTDVSASPAAAVVADPSAPQALGALLACKAAYAAAAPVFNASPKRGLAALAQVRGPAADGEGTPCGSQQSLLLSHTSTRRSLGRCAQALGHDLTPRDVAAFLRFGRGLSKHLIGSALVCSPPPPPPVWMRDSPCMDDDVACCCLCGVPGRRHVTLPGAAPGGVLRAL